MQNLNQMTLQDLKRLIDERINERLIFLEDRFEIIEETDDDEDNLTWDQIRELVERHRWTPPPGAKSSLELLREDRDR